MASPLIALLLHPQLQLQPLLWEQCRPLWGWRRCPGGWLRCCGLAVSRRTACRFARPQLLPTPLCYGTTGRTRRCPMGLCSSFALASRAIWRSPKPFAGLRPRGSRLLWTGNRPLNCGKWRRRRCLQTAAAALCPSYCERGCTARPWGWRTRWSCGPRRRTPVPRGCCASRRIRRRPTHSHPPPSGPQQRRPEPRPGRPSFWWTPAHTWDCSRSSPVGPWSCATLLTSPCSPQPPGRRRGRH